MDAYGRNEDENVVRAKRSRQDGPCVVPQTDDDDANDAEDEAGDGVASITVLREYEHDDSCCADALLPSAKAMCSHVVQTIRKSTSQNTQAATAIKKHRKATETRN